MDTHQLPGEIICTAFRTPDQVLSEPEIADVLRTATAPRDKAQLILLLGDGFRAAEAVRLDVPNVLSELRSPEPAPPGVA